jgi:5-methyltetrahydropteroyltriglutamate--homocysteine methyltransferase
VVRDNDGGGAESARYLEIDLSLVQAAIAPLDLGAKRSLAPGLAGRLAFMRQQLDEVVAVGRALTEGRSAIAAQLAAAMPAAPVANAEVRSRLDALGDGPPRSAYPIRHAARADGLPVLPTTTIGSSPQTEEIRKARLELRGRGR